MIWQRNESYRWRDVWVSSVRSNKDNVYIIGEDPTVFTPFGKCMYSYWFLTRKWKRKFSVGEEIQTEFKKQEKIFTELWVCLYTLYSCLSANATMRKLWNVTIQNEKVSHDHIVSA